MSINQSLKIYIAPLQDVNVGLSSVCKSYAVCNLVILAILIVMEHLCSSFYCGCSLSSVSVRGHLSDGRRSQHLPGCWLRWNQNISLLLLVIYCIRATCLAIKSYWLVDCQR